MRILACGLLLAWFVAAACSTHPSSSAASGARVESPAGRPLARASGAFDAEAAMPPGFPSDFPIYPHARLTAGASFASNGQVAWGMEWETLDAEAKVKSFYAKELNQGDWSMSMTADSDKAFTGKFTRKSDSRADGTIASNTDSAPVTKILVSLVYPG
jgi:hypothetical protein